MANIDKSNMRQVIIDSPSQLRKGLDLAKDIRFEGTFKNIIICGMGGSALPANVLNAIASPAIPVVIHRDYGLPKEAGENSMIICVSYSGNTEETVSALEEAIQKNFTVMGIATGGKMEKRCEENHIPLVKIPSGIQPRSATGYIFSVLAKFISNINIVDDLSQEILTASDELDKIVLQTEKQGKKLAEKIGKKIPVIYSSGRFKALSRIWKIKFNENSKTPSFWNYFPELNHNEMVGFAKADSKTKSLFVIILRSEADHPRTQKRMKLTASLLKKSGTLSEFVDIKNGSATFQIFSSLLLGDWTSYYLALKNKIDPTPVEIVENFKKLLEK